MMWQTALGSIKTMDGVEFQGAKFVPLYEHRILVVEGPDAEKFLQGQCTCDFSRLNSEPWIMGAHCSPKGRMNASFVAAKISDNCFGLRIHASNIAFARECLQKYAVFSKVSLSISEDYLALALLDLDKPPASSRELLHLAFEHGLNEFWLPASTVEDFVNAADIAVMGNENLWQLHNIRQGLAEVHGDLREKFLPQEMNFQFTNGVSFSKGCYTGQEIVARLHYRGQLKKHMRHGRVESDIAPKMGDQLVDIHQTDRPRGTVLCVAQNTDPSFSFLALCDDALMDIKPSGFQANLSAKIQWQALPYAIS